MPIKIALFYDNSVEKGIDYSLDCQGLSSMLAQATALLLYKTDPIIRLLYNFKV